MNIFLKLGSYIFHPLWMPLLGTLMYFGTTPRYQEPGFLGLKVIAIVITTILIPFVFFFILKNIGKVDSIHLKNVEERKYPLMIHCMLILLILKMVFNSSDYPEMYFFFVGVLFSSLTALICVFFKAKISLHQIGVAGILMFAVGLSAHFKINLLITISFLLFVNGWVASSRLNSEAHNYSEITLGFLIGAIPQLILFNFWL